MAEYLAEHCGRGHSLRVTTGVNQQDRHLINSISSIHVTEAFDDVHCRSARTDLALIWIAYDHVLEPFGQFPIAQFVLDLALVTSFLIRTYRRYDHQIK